MKSMITIKCKPEDIHSEIEKAVDHLRQNGKIGSYRVHVVSTTLIAVVPATVTVASGLYWHYFECELERIT